MLDADELAEMRVLQVRAYGREAELTEAEAARLRQLEDRRTTGTAEAPEPGVPDDRDAAGAAPREAASVAPREAWRAAPREAWVAELVEAPGAQRPASPTGPDATEAEDRGAESVLSPIRAHWRRIALAAAAALVAGVGLGWLLFGQPTDTPVALTPEQQEWQNALLAEGVYDSGSVRALAVEEDVVVWTATKDERKDTCLILGNGGEPRPSCQPTESVDEGLWGSLVTEIDDDVRREVVAYVLFAPSGEAAVRVDVVDQPAGSSAITYANEKETAIAEQLADDGFDPNSIWVAGYDGDVPIWTATELESQAQCLIFDGSTPTSPRVCADPQTMTEQDSGLVLNVVDTETGKTTTYEMSSNYGPSYLVITRERGELGAGGD